MNQSAQISTSLPISALLTSGASQSPSLSGAAAGQDFSALVEMLAALLQTNVIPQSCGQQAKTTVNNGSAQSAQQPASSASNDIPGLSARDLLNLLSKLTPKGAQAPSKKSDTSAATTYPVAGLPMINLLQLFDIQQPLPAQAPADASVSAQNPADLINKIEQQLSALVATGQSSQSPVPTSVAPTAEDLLKGLSAVAANPVTEQNPSAALTPKERADLLKLLSSASSATPDTKAMTNLEELPSKVSGDKNMSAEDLLKSLKGRAIPASNLNQDAKAGSEQMTPVSNQAAAQPAAIRDLPDRTIQAVSVSASRPAPQVAPPVVQQIAPQEPVTATPEPKAEVAAVGQPVSAAPSSRQEGHAAGAQSDQDKQSSSESDSDLPSLIKQNVGQVYASISDGNKVSFSRTLSVAAQNSPAPEMKPDINLIAQNIVKEAAVMTQAGKTVVNLKLQPEDLGTVTLRVSSESGKISAEFNVKTPDARAFLETSIPQMKQALETNGITLSHLSVSLSAGDSQNRRPQYQAAKQHARYYADLPTASSESTRSFGYNTIELKV